MGLALTTDPAHSRGRRSQAGPVTAYRPSVARNHHRSCPTLTNSDARNKKGEPSVDGSPDLG